MEAVRQLAPLIEGAGTVVFNGDTIEQRASNYRAKSLEMLSELEGLCAELGALPVFLTGNHDPSHWEQDFVDLAGQAFVTHGHVLLRYISPWSRNSEESARRIDALWEACAPDELDDIVKRFELARESCYAMEVYQPRFRRLLVAKLAAIAAEAWPPSRPYSVLQTWLNVPREAARFLERYRPGANIFVGGHTHLPGCWSIGDKTIINTGAFFIVLNAQIVEIAGDALTYRAVKTHHDAFVAGNVKRTFPIVSS